MDVPTFLPRKQLWQERQNLTGKTMNYHTDEYENYGYDYNSTLDMQETKPIYKTKTKGSIDSTYTGIWEPFKHNSYDSTWNSNTNYKPDSERKYTFNEPKKYSTDYFQECHLEFLEAFPTCPKCKHPDPNYFDFVTDDDDFILGKSCKKCKDCFIGMDDTKSIHDVENLLKIIKAPICSCGNEDINKYVLEKNDSNEDILQLRCCVCCRIVTSSDQPCNYETFSPDDFVLGNEDFCSCHSTNPDDYSVHFDETTGHVISIDCSRCNSVYQILNPVEQLPETHYSSNSNARIPTSLSEIKKSKPDGKCRAYHARDLKKGDHICFWRNLRWEHHAIVKNCNNSKNKITVIHYYPPQDKKAKGLVIETEICLDKDHADAKGSAEGILYIIKYNGPTFSPEKVVERAAERLGEQKYNFITHNCEHFARWCKTNAEGILKSEQICCILKGLQHYGSKIAGILTKDLVKSGLIKLAKTTAIIAPDVASDTVSAISTSAADQCAMLCSPIGIGAAAAGIALVTGIEIYNAHKHIKKTKQQLEEGKCDQATYENERCGAIAKCCFKIPLISAGGIGGTIAGGAVAGACALGSVGNFIVPIVGGLIGATLGAVLGWALGAGTKWLHAKYQHRK